MNIFFTGPKPSASHALVDFGDEGTTIKPFASFHLMPCLLLIDFLTVVHDHLRLIRNRLMLNSWTIFFCITFVIITRRYMQQSWTCLCLAISPGWTGRCVHEMSRGTSCLVALHVSWLFTSRGTSRLVALHVSWYVLHVSCYSMSHGTPRVVKSRFPREIFEFYTQISACSYAWTVTHE